LLAESYALFRWVKYSKPSNFPNPVLTLMHHMLTKQWSPYGSRLTIRPLLKHQNHVLVKLAPSIKWKQQRGLNSEMMNALYMHQNQLDNKISHQLCTNGLINVGTMLDTKDRQDMMLDI
jgi:hypothetical protein